jgi:hypothetical protein
MTGYHSVTPKRTKEMIGRKGKLNWKKKCLCGKRLERKEVMAVSQKDTEGPTIDK